MREREYFGESPVDLLTPDHLQERLAAGWKLVALEWERSGDEPGSEREAWVEEIPYGLQISSDYGWWRTLARLKSSWRRWT